MRIARPLLLTISVLWVAVATPTLASGEQIEIKNTKDSGGQAHLYLSGPCDQVPRHLESLRAWAYRGKQLPVPLPESKPLSTDPGRCEAEITRIVPKSVVNIHSTWAKNNGPNCWNAALVLSQILPSFRYSSNTEFSYWMSSPLCKQIRPDKRQPGDIGAIRKLNRQDPRSPVDIHAFIHIDNELVFSKNGLSRTSPYLLQSSDGMMKTYKTDPLRPDCRDLVQPNDNCTRVISYHRCQSFDEYVQNAKYQPSPEQTELRKKMEAIERAHSAALVGDSERAGLRQSEKIWTETIPTLEKTALDGLKVLHEERTAKKITPQEYDGKAFYWIEVLHRIQTIRNSNVNDPAPDGNEPD